MSFCEDFYLMPLPPFNQHVFLLLTYFEFLIHVSHVVSHSGVVHSLLLTVCSAIQQLFGLR